jgi:hypothetical protein
MEVEHQGLQYTIHKLSIALETGHEIVRPPTLPVSLSPITVYMTTDKKISFKSQDVEKLVNEAIDAVTVDNRKRCASHCKNGSGTPRITIYNP